MIQRRCQLFPGFLLVLFMAALGCGKGDANCGTVQGEVKLDGKPIVQGSILFAPAEGVQGAVASGEIANGHYRLSDEAGPAIGWNRVEISAMCKTGKMIQKPLAPLGEMAEGYEEAVPPRFNSASTLKVEVKPGDNTANFEIVSK